MHRRQLLAGCALSLWGAAAGAVTASLGVRAVVRRHSSVNVVDCAEGLVLSEEDIRRGWVRSTAPMTLAVRANHSDGIGLELLPMFEEIVCAEVSGPGVTWTGSPGGGRLQLPTAPGERRIPLDFRFALGPQARPGLHRWPVRISVTP